MSPQALIDEVAQRHGFSSSAVQEAVAALQRSSGSMAQFSHPELGGMGQWMPGMLMIGDMFNSGLKSRVDGLFQELAQRLKDFTLPPVPGTASGDAARATAAASGGRSMPPASSFSYGQQSSSSSSWYPAELGTPSSSGGQNNFRYAFFPSTRRLAMELDGKTTIYDTEDHMISGVSQQQESAGGRITFTSQRGTVDVSQLKKV